MLTSFTRGQPNSSLKSLQVLLLTSPFSDGAHLIKKLCLDFIMNTLLILHKRKVISQKAG